MYYYIILLLIINYIILLLYILINIYYYFYQYVPTIHKKIIEKKTHDRSNFLFSKGQQF